MKFAKQVPIEFPIFLYAFAVILATVIQVNFLMYQVCTVTLNKNEADCKLLESKDRDNETQLLEKEIQPYVTTIAMILGLMQTVFPAFVCFFTGPWSDTYGRKKVLLLNFGAFTSMYLITTIISAIPTASPWWLVVSTLPLFLSGGLLAALAAVLCYITDITTLEQRGFRMTTFYSTVTVATLIALTASSYILSVLGFLMSYGLILIASSLGFIIVLFSISESLPNPQKGGGLKNLFKLSVFINTVKTACKKREHNKRMMLLFVGIFLILQLINEGANQLNYLYLRATFGWTLENYSLFRASKIVLGTAGSALAIYILHKKLHVNESVLIFLGLISMSMFALIRVLATENWHIYISVILNCFEQAINPMSKTLMSKLVPPEDYSKVYAFSAFCESIFSNITYPLLTFIYNSTLLTHPEAYNYVLISFYILGIILCTFTYILQRKNVTNLDMDNKNISNVKKDDI